MRDREISEQLFLLCDTAVEGGQEGLEVSISDLSREELEAILAEAVDELLDATSRADREIERFERRRQRRVPDDPS